MNACSAILAGFLCFSISGVRALPEVTGTRETAYQRLVRLRREAKAQAAAENLSLGPVVATVPLKLTPIRGTTSLTLLGPQRRGTTATRPPQIKGIPADVPPEPVYFTVRVGDKDLTGITYRSVRRPMPVKLFLDTDSDGLFSDETQYVGTWQRIFKLTRTYYFGTVTTGPGIPGAKAGAFNAQCSDGKWLMCYPAFSREGAVALEGRRCKMALVDADFDGRYDGRFVPPARGFREPGCDILALDLDGDGKFRFHDDGDSEIVPLCRLVKVGPRYYDMEVAEDGSVATFRRATPEYGTLDLGGAEVKMTLWSDVAHQFLQGSRGTWRLPAGRYSAIALELNEEDSGARWTFEMGKTRSGLLGEFEIRPGESTAVKIGPPFQIRASMRRYSQNVSITFDLEGQAGERYRSLVKKNGAEAPEPSFKIVDRSGRVAHSGRFEYG